MKTFESFVNKSEYDMLCVHLDTYEDGVRVQQLCFDNEIYWNNRYKDDTMRTFGEILDGEHIDNYLYIKMLKGQERLYRSTDYEPEFIKQFKHPNRVFTIRNFREVEGILKYGRIAPSYAPRKIIRESLDMDRYQTLSEELKKRGIIIYVTPSSRMDALRFLDAINKSIKLEQNKNKLEYSFAKSYTIENWYDDPKVGQKLYFTFVTNSNTKRLEINVTTGDDSWPTRYPEWFISTSERELISRLFGIIITPSYEPRKIDRTLEAVEWYPYRFKTAEELVKQFGEDWHFNGAFGEVGWSDDMLHLLGKDFPYSLDELHLELQDKGEAIKRLPLGYSDGYGYDDEEKRFIDENGISWLICWDMLTKNRPSSPSYAPRKINRTLESVDNIKWIEAIFELKNSQESDFAQSELFRRGYHWWTGENSQEIKMYRIFPQYLFVNFTNDELTCCNLRELDVATIKDYIDRFNRTDSDAINPKVFVARDVLNVESIKSRGDVAPNYNPRKIVKTLERLNEDYFLDNDKLLYKIEKDKLPKFMIGDTVVLKKNALTIQGRGRPNYDLDNNQRDFIRQFMGKPIKIIRKFIPDNRFIDDKDKIWWSCFQFEHPESDEGQVWIIDATLTSSEPNYKPRKIIRNLDTEE